ncbi:MAG: multiple sugar transport system ATP-binding protein [Trebonia sp.]|jgi:multiple sugar transport system ATP-binding protein|nr:putative transporter ATP-binding protein [Actinomycetes bacterium]MDX6420509.1 multiple sugar transport system ATP-binding protein [Trebonia sp.]
MADIVVRGVTKSFDRGRVTAVSDVDLTVADGEFFVLLGPSGCGKTTLLRMIAGLEFADSGTVTIGNRDVTTLPPRRRDLAMVFQNYAVFPHLTVFENIAFGLKMKHTDAATIDERVRWAADLVELSGLLQRSPGQLSGGQRQRVAVARAIAAGPSVLLMDEPLSSLDALLRLKFRSDLKRISRELKTTTVYVTHDQVEALSLGDRLAVMRDGRIVQCDAPLRVYEHPVSTFVGGFIGNPPMNFLPATVEVTDGRLLARVGAHAFPAPEELRGLAGRRLLAGIRGENVVTAAGPVPGAVPGRVRVVEPLGSHVLVTVMIEDTEFKVLAQSDFAAAEDAELWLRPVPEKVRWFDPDTEREVRADRDPAGSRP